MIYPEKVVIDQQKWEWSQMWKKEDWWAIWLGFLLIIAGMLIFLPRGPRGHDGKIGQGRCHPAGRRRPSALPHGGVAQSQRHQERLRATNEPYAKSIAKWLQMPGAGAATSWNRSI
jgi:hypothetical protein